PTVWQNVIGRRAGESRAVPSQAVFVRLRRARCERRHRLALPRRWQVLRTPHHPSEDRGSILGSLARLTLNQTPNRNDGQPVTFHSGELAEAFFDASF